jgi:hypothetical protein
VLDGGDHDGAGRVEPGNRCGRPSKTGTPLPWWMENAIPGFYFSPCSRALRR